MTMTDTPPVDEPDEPTLPDPEPEPAPNGGEDALQAQLVAMRGELARITTAPRPVAPTRFANLGELMKAAAFDHERGRAIPREVLGSGVAVTQHVRAWNDTLTTDVPGLIPPQQVKQLFDVIAANQQLVEAAGPFPAPTSLTITYPKVTQRPQVAAQATQKTEIASRKITVSAATAQVATYGGGSDVSVQTIQLSDPSYLTIEALLYAEEMARATDAGAYAIYDAAVPAGHNASIGAAATGWNQALFNLAGLILTDARRFPDRLIVSTDMWAKLGGAADATGRPLFTAASPSNPVGTMSLTGPDGEIRGLGFTVDPNFPADRGVMFASDAFRASVGPVQTLTADVPRLLGQDRAVFRFAGFPVVDANGLAMFATGTAPTVFDAEGKAVTKKSKGDD